MSNDVHQIDLKKRRFTSFYSIFYLYTFAFVMLNCGIVLFIVELERPKTHTFILCIFMNNKGFL